MDKYYREENAYSDSDESVHSIDEKVKQFTLQDYLNFPKTREILETFHYQTFLETAAMDLQHLLDDIDDYCNRRMASTLRLDFSQNGKGIIVGMVYNHLEKKYDLKIFDDYPELIKPLITAEKEKNNNNS